MGFRGRSLADRTPPPAIDGEVWRIVIDGYWVSDQGRLWSECGARVMSPGQTGSRRQYLAMPLRVGPGARRMCSIHRLVLEAFVGPCPAGHEAAHLNGDSRDNRLINLAWVTASENNRHKVAHGTQRRGEQIKSAKLTAGEVLAARSARRQGETVAAIARCYGLSQRAMRAVLVGRTWAHVPGAVRP